MSRVIGVLNYKGGTGKTTTVVNLAAGLALRGARVLCIDMDTQGSLATSFGVSYEKSLSNLLLGQAEAEDCIVKARKNCDLIAADASLFEVEGELWRMNDDLKAWRILADKMKDVEGYDYIILDNSPSMNNLSRCGLFFASEVIVPVSMDYLSLVGTRQVIQVIKSVADLPEKKASSPVQLSLIVPTLYYGRLRKDQEVVKTLKRYFADKVTRPIRSNVKLSEAPSHQMTIYEYAPRSHGASDYAQLVERVVDNG